MRIICVLTFFCISLFSMNLYADETFCKKLPLDAVKEQILLPGTVNGSVFFIQNKSTTGVWLDHPRKRELQAGWSTFLRAGNWSALLMNKKDFILTCAEITPGVVKMHDCEKVISVCQVKDTFLRPKLNNSYWIAEDLNYDDLLKAAKKRKIVKS